jgi:EYS protein
MIIPSQRFTHKDKRNGLQSSSSRLTINKYLQLSLNFSTINVDGILLWNDNKNIFLGVGLENGFLKVVSNALNFRNDQIDVSQSGFLTDGAWHNVKLDINEQGQVTVVVDKRTVYNEGRNVVNNLDLLGESFYLGMTCA